MKKILFLTMIGMVLALTPIALGGHKVFAADNSVKGQICQGISQTGGDCSSDGTGDINGLITNVVNILSVIVGIVAVIMIIASGLKFITSGGESSAVASAKKTIMYALVGLIVVGLAQIIVHFVVGHIVGV